LLILPDAGDPEIRHAQGAVDLARLLHWLPKGLTPVSAERAKLQFRVDGLRAPAGSVVPASGIAEADAELAGVAVELGARSLRIGDGRLALHAQPVAGGGIAGKVGVSLSRVELGSSAKA